jgi:hypothetical protein
MTLWFRGSGVALCVLVGGCLGPMGSDRPGYSRYLLADGAVLPSLDDDKRLAQQIDTNDAIDSMHVALRSAYSGGHELRYWDFGTASSSAFPPIWMFRRQGADKQAVDFGHPNLIDSIPGDTNYSPIHAVYTVVVTKAYAGQQIASTQALDDAQELGLVKKPVATGFYVNCPVTFAEVTLDLDGAEAAHPTQVYYRSMTTHCFELEKIADVSPFELDKGKVSAPNAYLLRRQNESRVLDEALWKADLDGDGDMSDTNTIFEVEPGNVKYIALWRQINVTVPDAYSFGSAGAEADLFMRGSSGLQAIDGAVVDYQDTGTLLDRPIYGGTP